MQEWILKYWIEVLFGIINAGVIAGYKKLFHNITTKFKEQDAVN